MSVFFSSFLDLKEKFKVFAFDQWGVLHDGTKPYNGAIECIKNLSKNNATIFILTNSGKREKENLIRISNIGFDLNYITKVISSGETLWNSIASHDLPFKISYPINFFVISREKYKICYWLKDNPGGNQVSKISQADCILLLGIPDNSKENDFEKLLKYSLSKNIPILCGNPDNFSPRQGGNIIISSGRIAQIYMNMGGKVYFFGKPYLPIFDHLHKLSNFENKDKIAVVGDSLEHDIYGGNKAGMKTVLVLTGIHNKNFKNLNSEKEKHDELKKLTQGNKNLMPDYVINDLVG